MELVTHCLREEKQIPRQYGVKEPSKLLISVVNKYGINISMGITLILDTSIHTILQTNSDITRFNYALKIKGRSNYMQKSMCSSSVLELNTLRWFM